MTAHAPQKPHRRSIRLKGHDYPQSGAYFVTIVTQGRECVFGEIKDGEMRLNSFGSLADNEWRRLGERFNQVMMDEWIVMPNHLHEILVIMENDTIDPVGARQEDSIQYGVGAGQENLCLSGESSFAPPLPKKTVQNLPRLITGSLGAIVGVYKSTTARLINGLRRTPGASLWQRNYYEHTIRDEGVWDAIRAYIRNNTLEWELDSENPANSR